MKKIIEIQEEIEIGDVILEKGDKIKILDENMNYYRDEIKSILPEDEYGVSVQFNSTKGKTKWMNVNSDFFKALESLKNYFLG